MRERERERDREKKKKERESIPLNNIEFISITEIFLNSKTF